MSILFKLLGVQFITKHKLMENLRVQYQRRELEQLPRLRRKLTKILARLYRKVFFLREAS